MPNSSNFVQIRQVFVCTPCKLRTAFFLFYAFMPLACLPCATFLSLFSFVPLTYEVILLVAHALSNLRLKVCPHKLRAYELVPHNISLCLFSSLLYLDNKQ